MKSETIKPFHEWKKEFKEKDLNLGIPIIRSRDFYYAKYGHYCSAIRQSQTIKN